MRTRIQVAVIAAVVAGCSSTAVSPPVPADTTQTTTRPPSMGIPSTAATALDEPSASVPVPSPAEVSLPAALSDVAWASEDLPTGLVTFGVLGGHARGTRLESPPGGASTVGGFVLIPEGSTTDVVDAATGATLSRFRPAAIELSAGYPTGPASPPRKLLVDPRNRLLYVMDSGTQGLLIRRYALDGSHGATLARLGPDALTTYWDAVDMVLADDGHVLAVACPPTETAQVGPCQLYDIPPGATEPVAPRDLPAGTPAPCFLLGSTAASIVGIVRSGFCRADGGPGPTVQYVVVSRKDGYSTVGQGPSSFQGFGVRETSDGTALIGNAAVISDGPKAFDQTAVSLLIARDLPYPTTPLVEESRPGWTWVLLAAGPDWTLTQSLGPEYASCHLIDPASQTCPVGPVVLTGPKLPPTALPPGTYGEPLSPPWLPF